MLDFLRAEMPKLTAMRRELHANPELSLQERWTSGFVAARLREYGITVVEGVGGHGIVGVVQGSASGPGVALRADMDALPITEETGLSYSSSRSGVMHACGHDGHMAALIGAGAALAKSRDFVGSVHLVFQPAEEMYGGAQIMIDDGLLERFPSRQIFGLHNWPGLPVGEVMVHDGPVMAGARDFNVAFRAHGGHAGMPQTTGDPILAAGHFVTGLQQAVARAVDPCDPAVATVAMIQGGSAHNVIPDLVRLQGTLRAFDTATLGLLCKRLEAVAAAAANIAGSMSKVDYEDFMLSPVVNTPTERDQVREAARRGGLAIHSGRAVPSMAGDDFGAFLQHLPGAYAWIGNGDGHRSAHLHQSNYDFNDDIIVPSAALLVETARVALSSAQ
ncbi:MULTISPECIES: amidohydrolase [unclassified Rhizobium]|jgi:amidohydrolase|uniref:amidohydrolase n=1 Tax=unclassified Rhizobium TaxID=2613769 RepID=UPI000645696F|nr:MULTISPECIES: amidohydrolase [unclassified Rhizobium]OJY65571.1 MAG: hypothetical protein BGP09_21635 [Rhizobium sp. 60-20]RKD35775.1 hippurate hydrolase [Rhizobium sp. WW_1]